MSRVPSTATQRSSTANVRKVGPRRDCHSVLFSGDADPSHERDGPLGTEGSPGSLDEVRHIATVGLWLSTKGWMSSIRFRDASARLDPMDLSVRDGETSDVPCLREIFRRASLSNSGDRSALLAHPHALDFLSRPSPTAGSGWRPSIQIEPWDSRPLDRPVALSS
jgi:hypothetical protein